MSAQRKPIPDDFQDHLDKPYHVLEQMYHVHWTTVRRWKQEFGYAITNGSTKKPVLQYDEDKALIKRYRSIQEAAKQAYINRNSISRCCYGRQKQAGGYFWRFDGDIKDGEA